jgi:hypothetical protein
MATPNRGRIVGAGIQPRLTLGDTVGCWSVWSKDQVNYGHGGSLVLMGLGSRHRHPHHREQEEQPKQTAETDLEKKTHFVRLV